LDAAANRLAHHLIAQRIGPESLVGIAMERSIEMVVALLAILKAGAAYLPLDPQYPAERLRFMLRDSGAKLVLTTSEIAQRLTPDGNESKDTDATPLLLLDDPAVGPDLASRPDAAPTDKDRTTPLNPSNLAYVIYTSGSTGQPKGVGMPCGPLINLLLWQQTALPVVSGDRALNFASISFDVAFQE